MNKEIVKHTIKVDNYLEATLSIPKELDAFELKAIMTKVNSLFRLSEPTIECKEPSHVDVDNTNIAYKDKKTRYGWNEEQTKLLIKLVAEQKTNEEIAQQIGKPVNTIKNRKFKLHLKNSNGKSKYKIHLKPSSKPRRKMPVELKIKIMEQFLKCRTVEEKKLIVTQYGFNNLSELHRRIFDWKNRQHIKMD